MQCAQLDWKNWTRYTSSLGERAQFHDCLANPTLNQHLHRFLPVFLGDQLRPTDQVLLQEYVTFVSEFMEHV